MGSTFFPSTTITCKNFPDFHPLTLNCRFKRGVFPQPTCRNSINHKIGFISTASYPPFLTGFGRRNICLKNPSTRFADIGDIHPEPKDEEEEEEDRKALEAVLRLYSALKNRDKQGLSDILCEECHCMSNFKSAFKPVEGKQQVIEFFSSIMKSLGDNVEFIVQPTSHNGLNIGVSWRLECKKTHAPLGKGFSFHMCHVYEGRVVIRNVEMFMEPLIHVEPLRLKIMRVFIAIMNTLGCYKLLKGLGSINNGIYVVLSLLLMVVSLFLLKLSLS